MPKKQIILVAPAIWHDTLKQSLDEAGVASGDAVTVVNNVYALTAIIAETYLPEKKGVTICIMVDYLDGMEMEIFKTLCIYDHLFMVAIATSSATMGAKLFDAKNNGAHIIIRLDEKAPFDALVETPITPLPLIDDDDMIVDNQVQAPEMIISEIEATAPVPENEQESHLDFETLEKKLDGEMPTEISRTEYNNMEITDLELDALLGHDEPNDDDQT